MTTPHAQPTPLPEGQPVSPPSYGAPPAPAHHSAPPEPYDSAHAAPPYAPAPAPHGAAHPGDLTLPLYGASFGQAITRFFKNYATFSGRSSRSEF